MNSIKVVSDGTPMNTKVFNHSGAEIQGITSIIMKISADTFMTAVLTFENVQAEIIADWNNHPLKQWANKKTGKRG